MSENVDASTRLFNLACALLYAREGLSKKEIFSRVHGYTPHSNGGANKVALDQLFNRDKKILLAAGIKFKSGNPDSLRENDDNYVYKISKEEFLWPSGFTLTPRQIGLLNLASTVWTQAALSKEAANAALRVKGLGEVEDINEFVALAPRLRTHHPSFLIFTKAIEDGALTSFVYRKPGESKPEQRMFRPWQLENISGQWLVMGFDEKVGETRNFLLKRIISQVSIEAAEKKPFTATDLARAKANLDEFIAGNVATIKVQPDTAAWFKFEMDSLGAGKTDEISFNFMDVHLLADELRQYAGTIEVLKPAGLREMIEAGFEKVVEQHHD